MTVHAVIVAYRPCVATLARLCRALAASHAPTVVVDNGDTPGLAAELSIPGCTVLCLRRNTGIAHAQNVGIRHAIAFGAEVIAFFDQDSVIDHGFLGALLAPLTLGRPEIVAPISYDQARSYEYPGLRLDRLGLPRKVYSRQVKQLNPVDIVISSGTAATIETFAAAGMMDEDLFIDFVDTEWCLRCRAKGVSIRIVPAAVMLHSIGDGSISLGRLTVSLHGPPRSYYQLRNSLLLFRKECVPFGFALWTFASVLSHKLLMLLFVPDRRPLLREYLSGMWHGGLGRIGSTPPAKAYGANCHRSRQRL